MTVGDSKIALKTLHRQVAKISPTKWSVGVTFGPSAIFLAQDKIVVNHALLEP